MTKLILFVGALFVMSTSAFAQTTVVQFNCGSGLKLWLYGEGTDFSCQQQGSFWACSDQAGSDTARGSCSKQCEEIRTGTLAGCFYGPTSPGFTSPYFSIICPNGQIYDLIATAEGDTCVKTEDTGGETTGGKCGKKEGNGQISNPTVTMDCNEGCLQAQNPGDCTVRKN